MRLLRLCFAIILTVCCLLPALADATVYGQAVTQTYGVDGNLQRGMIVTLARDSSKVRPLSSGEDATIQGVIVAATDSAVSLTGDGSSDQVYVASAGKYDVLVSTQNGPVKSGDYIAISSLDGIGMKADSGQALVLGKALASFDGSGTVSGNAQLGGGARVAIGLIPVDVAVSRNPLKSAANADTAVPGFLRKIAQTLTGKDVSAPRIYISLAILLLTTLITGCLLFAAVRSSLISIGRNPLARKSVLRGLLEVVLLGIIILIIGLFAIYLVLKL